MLLAEPLYLGVNRGDAVFQHSKLAQIREKLHGMIVLRWPTSGDEIFHLPPCGRFALRQVSQIAFSRQGREPLALRFLTRGAFGVVAPLFLFPGVRRDEQVADTLMYDAADVPPAWTPPEQADEFRVSMTLYVKRHPSEPPRFLTL